MNDTENLRIYIDGKFVQLESKLDTMNLQLHDNTRYLARMQSPMPLNFGITALFIVFIALICTYALIFNINYFTKKNSLTEQDVREIVRDEFSRLKAEFKTR